MFLSFLISGFVLSQDCNYELSVPVFSFNVGDINPSTEGIVNISRPNEGSNSRNCDNFFLAFTKGWSGNYNRRAFNLRNSNLLYYNLYKNNNQIGVLKEPNDITSSNEVLFGTIAKNTNINLSYYFTMSPINANTPPLSGTYIDVIQVQSYSGTYSNIKKFQGYRDLYIYLNVAKFVSLSLIDSGGAYDAGRVSKTLDFGEIEENETLGFDVRIVSNSGYILKISSSNNGLLKRTGASGARSEVNYDFYANNTKKSLSSSAGNPVSLDSGTGVTSSGGALVPIKVVIGNVTDKDSGTYQDYLTLSVISND
jgi:spore coat protein U-like protein